MKKIFLILLFFAFSVSQAWAATLYLRDDAVNWTDAASWSNVGAADNTNSGPPTASDTCIAELLSGNVTINLGSTCGSFSTTAGTGNWGGTLTHNPTTWTIAGDITFNSGMTYTPSETSTVNLSGNNTLTTAGKLFPFLVLNFGITTTLGDNLTFMASKIIVLRLDGDSLNINGKTVSGNSAINRVLIRSNTIGTARTITTTTGTFDAADFRDITASTAINLSAVTNHSGDCGGNTNITFTTPATQTWDGTSGGNWSTNAWSGRVPLCQDTVAFSTFIAGQTITADMPRLGGSISFASATNTPTLSANTLPMEIYGSLNLTGIGTFTTGSTGPWTFLGRGSFTLTSNGKAFDIGSSDSITFSLFGGSMTLLDAFSSNGEFNHSQGTLDSNGMSLTARAITSSGTSTRAITTGLSTWTATRTGSVGANFTFTTTGMTANFSGSTLVSSNISTSGVTFGGGGLTFNNYSITGGGTGSVTITGSNTFNTLTVGVPKTVIFTSGTTQTISSLIANGSSGNVVTVQSSSAGSAASLSDSSGTNLCHFCSIKDSTATGGASFRAYNSTNVSGNSGWVFPYRIQQF